MIVVIPVCHKDESLVLKNLEWIAQLDGKIDGEAVISCPEGFDSASVLEQVTRIFPTDRTHTIRYPEWGGDSKWPHPQNWAWQSTARAIYHTGSPWLWWEADATPVKKGWLKAIQNEYESASKPFMGCILDGDGWSTPHMAGVGVYPADVINYSTNAMLCRAAPFDIVLWPDIESHTHRANHLIQHHVRENGDSTNFPDCASVGEIVQPGVVLFHRCKDGSLIDQLRNPTPRTSKLKAQRAFWFKKKTPQWRSILKQTPWEAGFFDLPSHDRECHFNCAITQQQDTKWLVSRRWQRTPPMTWRSDLVRHRLNPDLTIAESFPILLPKQCGAMEQHEDPRIINRGAWFSLGYCSWLMGAKFQAHQALAALDANWNCQSTFHLIYGKNGPGPGAGTGHEKNWVWFYHDLALHVDYQFSPHIVLKVANETTFEEFKTETPLASKWQHGHIRGGTPPVRIGEEYISFFHSSMPWRARQNRYFMGAYAFEAKPPFAVTRITPKPLLGGSEDDPRSLGGPVCVFPDGLLIKDDHCLVTLGVNDQACAWIKIPMRDLEKRMTNVL